MAPLIHCLSHPEFSMGHKIFLSIITTKNRLGASSLVEVTVAAALFVIVTGASLMLYLQVTRSTHSLQELKWEMWLKSYLQRTIDERQYQNQTLIFPEGEVEKKISRFGDEPNLLLLEVTFTFTEEMYTGNADTLLRRLTYRQVVLSK